MSSHQRGDDDPGGAILRIPALDGLRGIAVLLVLGIHFGVAADFALRWRTTVGATLERLFYIGWTGVDLFFVLSGFLISSILLTSRDNPRYFRLFYGRRALRIFPLYYFAILLTLFVVPVVWPARAPELLDNARSDQIWLWTYTLNVATTFGWAQGTGVLAHFWTLAIEEQYYLVWPSVVKLTSDRALAVVCGVLIVGAFCLRVMWVSWNLPDGWAGAYHFTLTRVDALAVGGLIAVLIRDPVWQRRLEAIATPGFAIGAIAVAAALVLKQRVYPNDVLVVTAGHTVLALTFGCLVVLGVRGGLRAISGPRWRSLGKYSYGIYVWHWPLQRIMFFYHDAIPPPVFAAAGVAGSIALGVVSFHLIEQPFLRLKRFFAYKARPDRVPGVNPAAGAVRSR